MKKSRSHGFTLLELIVGIAVLSVLLGIAVPSFRDTLRNNRIVGRTNELIAALTLTRSSADGGKIASICAANAALSACVTSAGVTDWSNGWLVFVDHRTSGTVGTYDSANDTMLQRSSIGDVGAVTIGGSARVVTFDTGGVRGANPFTFDLTKAGCKGPNSRQVTVAAPGVGKISFTKVNCP